MDENDADEYQRMLGRLLQSHQPADVGLFDHQQAVREQSRAVLQSPMMMNDPGYMMPNLESSLGQSLATTNNAGTTAASIQSEDDAAARIIVIDDARRRVGSFPPPSSSLTTTGRRSIGLSRIDQTMAPPDTAVEGSRHLGPPNRGRRHHQDLRQRYYDLGGFGYQQHDAPSSSLSGPINFQESEFSTLFPGGTSMATGAGDMMGPSAAAAMSHRQQGIISSLSRAAAAGGTTNFLLNVDDITTGGISRSRSGSNFDDPFRGGSSDPFEWVSSSSLDIIGPSMATAGGTTVSSPVGGNRRSQQPRSYRQSPGASSGSHQNDEQCYGVVAASNDLPSGYPGIADIMKSYQQQQQQSQQFWTSPHDDSNRGTWIQQQGQQQQVPGMLSGTIGSVAADLDDPMAAWDPTSLRLAPSSRQHHLRMGPSSLPGAHGPFQGRREFDQQQQQQASGQQPNATPDFLGGVHDFDSMALDGGMPWLPNAPAGTEQQQTEHIQHPETGPSTQNQAQLDEVLPQLPGNPQQGSAAPAAAPASPKQDETTMSKPDLQMSPASPAMLSPIIASRPKGSSAMMMRSMDSLDDARSHDAMPMPSGSASRPGTPRRGSRIQERQVRSGPSSPAKGRSSSPGLGRGPEGAVDKKHGASMLSRNATSKEMIDRRW